MIGRTARAFAIALLVGAAVPALSVALIDPAHAVVGAAEQAVLDTVQAAESEAGPAAQLAHIMASGLSGPQKGLAIQWLIEGAATDGQASALADAVVAAAAAATAAHQPGLVATLGTGLGQAYKALALNGRSSAAEAVLTVMLEAVGADGALGGASRSMAVLFAGSFSSASSGTPRSAVGVSEDEDSVDPGQTDTPNPPSQA